MGKNAYLDGMMGLIVGDALGVPVEFTSREERKADPVTDMREYGTYHMPKGTWSDDSSMALATLDALKDGYHLERIMSNFVDWMEDAVYTPYREVFDAGCTCCTAIDRYIDYPEQYDVHNCGCTGERENGNGSLMRILPACIYLYHRKSELPQEEILQRIHDISALTHAHLRSKMACGLYYFLVEAILDAKILEQTGSLGECLQKGMDAGLEFYGRESGNLAELGKFDEFRDLAEFKKTAEGKINGSGYVVASFEAALWCLLNTESYRECVLKAVNLGDDTDTTAAIAGGLAGLYYGYEAIPEEWRNAIVRRECVEEMCEI